MCKIDVRNFEHYETLVNSGVKLPSNESIDLLVAGIGEIYRKFDSDGKFYKSKSHMEYGRTYYDILETSGIGESYTKIKDWLNELTGRIGINFIPESFEDIVHEILNDFIYDEIEQLNNVDTIESIVNGFDGFQVELFLWLEGEIHDLSIELIR